jgi:hypothetical protein
MHNGSKGPGTPVPHQPPFPVPRSPVPRSYDANRAASQPTIARLRAVPQR